jgi:CheY-like chemotaxis protein
MSEQKTVMIVEDDQAIREACQIKLQLDGLKVLSVGNGQEALEILKNNKPDLILLDLIMPKMNGFDFLEALRKDPEHKNDRVVIMSNLGQETDIESGKKLGVEDYLIKANCSIGEIATKVKEWLV